MRQMEFRRVRRRWPGVTSQLLYMTCRAFMRRNADLPGFRYTFIVSCRIVSCRAHCIMTVTLRCPSEARASKGDGR